VRGRPWEYYKILLKLIQESHCLDSADESRAGYHKLLATAAVTHRGRKELMMTLPFLRKLACGDTSYGLGSRQAVIRKQPSLTSPFPVQVVFQHHQAWEHLNLQSFPACQ
jgi:hypothetical protein